MRTIGHLDVLAPRAAAALGVALLCTAAGVTTAAPARASSTSPCVPNSYGTYCLAPTTTALSTSGPNCTPFPDGREWQDFTDANGVHQYWTYSNGGNACVRVTYNLPSSAYLSGKNCYFSFYVPL